MNCNPNKPEVALAQAYFVDKTIASEQAITTADPEAIDDPDVAAAQRYLALTMRQYELKQQARALAIRQEQQGQQIANVEQRTGDLEAKTLTIEEEQRNLARFYSEHYGAVGKALGPKGKRVRVESVFAIDEYWDYSDVAISKMSGVSRSAVGRYRKAYSLEHDKPMPKRVKVHRKGTIYEQSVPSRNDEPKGGA